LIPQEERTPISVSALNELACQLLEGSLGHVYVIGEVSGFIHHRSGHWYFTLKDEQAQIKCACFKGQQRGVSFQMRDGLQIIVQGKVTLYQPQGSYQLVVTGVWAAGAGLLQQKFEQLKKKLQEEGLFDVHKKRALPRFCHRVGVVTSTEGAAVCDFIRVAQAYDPEIQILVLPTRVQGQGSAQEIVAMIEYASLHAQSLGLSALVLTRGGGSIEDLWSFNEEIVVRALAACTIPTISAIGHEIDYTLCDYVADVRAPTPTAAAQLVAINKAQLKETLAQYVLHLKQLVSLQVSARKSQIQARALILKDPARQMSQYRQALDDKLSKMESALGMRLNGSQKKLQQLQAQLQSRHPQLQYVYYKQHLQQIQQMLGHHVRAQVLKQQQHNQALAGRLQAMSPLSVLSRGYSVTINQDTGQAMTQSNQIQEGHQIKVILEQGALIAQVIQCVSSAKLTSD